MSPGTQKNRKRTCKPKSRTGCVTCKIRRVKCDESKPICSRCRKFGVGDECAYSLEESLRGKRLSLLHPRPGHRSANSFDDNLRGRQLPLLYPRPGSVHQTHVVVPIYPRISLLGARNPSASVPGNAEERRYFELFREKVAYIICGYFETPFWTRFIPQLCHHEPAVRHEIIALSALYKSSTYEDDIPWYKDDYKKLAFLHQDKALSHLRKSLSGDVRLALITSLLFGYFESMQGDWEMATQQLYSGRKLLKEWKTARGSSDFDMTGSAHAPPVIDPEIAPALGRLEMHLMTFLTMNPVYSPPFADDCDDVLELLGCIPDRFPSLEIAFPYACQIINWILKTVRKSVRYSYCITSEAATVSMARHPSGLKRDFEIWEQVSKWYKSIKPLFNEQDLEVATKENLGILQCHVCALVFETILATSMGTEECVFDIFSDRFKYIVNSSCFLFQNDQRFRLVGASALPSGMGLIYALYYTATRCRDYKLRSEAIGVLRQFPSRNGVWDSIQVAKVASWVADLEEAERDERGIIAEGSRVRTHTLKWTAGRGRINVECMQGLVGDELKLRKATLSVRDDSERHF